MQPNHQVLQPCFAGWNIKTVTFHEPDPLDVNLGYIIDDIDLELCEVLDANPDITTDALELAEQSLMHFHQTQNLTKLNAVLATLTEAVGELNYYPQLALRYETIRVRYLSSITALERHLGASNEAHS